GQPPDFQGRFGELFGQQAKPRNDRRPAPISRLQIQQIDLEGIARLGPFYKDRPVHLIDAAEVQRLDGVQRGVGHDLPTRRLQQIEFDYIPRLHAIDRRDRVIPGQVPLVAGDMDARAERAHRASPFCLLDATVSGIGSYVKVIIITYPSFLSNKVLQPKYYLDNHDNMIYNPTTR